MWKLLKKFDDILQGILRSSQIDQIIDMTCDIQLMKIQ